MSIIEGKTVLVTGGTGSIGNAIVRKALSENANKVIVFSRDEIKQFLLADSISDSRLITLVGDIRDIESTRKIFEENEIDIVFHVAAMKHLVVCENEPLECIKTNIIGTENITRLSKQYGISHFVGISTDKAASPTNVMGASKLIAERIVLNANRNSKGSFSCVRFGNVANTRGSVIPIMVQRIIDDKDIWISNENVTRFIMSIEDAVNLVVETLENAYGGELFILKMKSFRLGDLGKVMLDNVVPKMSQHKTEIITTKLAQGEKLHEDLMNDIDSNNLYENDKMFLVPLIQIGEEILKKYPSFKATETRHYKSNKVEMLDEHEIWNVIKLYIKQTYNRDI